MVKTTQLSPASCISCIFSQTRSNFSERPRGGLPDVVRHGGVVAELAQLHDDGEDAVDVAHALPGEEALLHRG